MLGGARLLGEGARRLSLPSVVGEIAAGVMLGPSLLGSLIPAAGRWIAPQTVIQAQLLDLVGLVGVLLLMIVVGLETDLGLVRARASTAIGVGLGGLVVPMAGGLALGLLMPADLRGGADRLVFSLFLAIALALSAIPVLARVLMDLDLMRRDFGQVLLAAGMIDDILGWTLLGIATSLAGAGTIDGASIALTVGSIAAVLVATAAVVRPLARRSLAFVHDRFRSRDRLLTLIVVMALAWAAVTHALHLEALLGAFAVGVVFGQMRRLPLDVGRHLESVTFGIFAPVFLATAGLRLDLGALIEPRLLGLTVLVVVVATTGKVAGAYAGARLLARRGHWESLGYGAGLNARGVLGIIVAALGLSLGIISVEVYSMIVVMSVATSLMAPAALRWAVGHIDRFGADDVGRSEDGGIRRVLVPVRPRFGPLAPVQGLEAAVVERLGGTEPPAVTLLAVTRRRTRGSAADHLGEVARQYPRTIDVTRRLVIGDDPLPPILDEAGNDYDLIVVGASEHPDDATSHLFSSVVDEVVRLAPCPTLVVRARALAGSWPPDHILVPVDGSPASRRAVDIAFAIAGLEAEVVAFHVVAADAATLPAGRSGSPGVRLEVGRQIVEDVRTAAEPLGVTVSTEVVTGGDTAGTILDRADAGIGLVVLGTTVRAGSQRLFLGPNVERVLHLAPCPVIVVNGV